MCDWLMLKTNRTLGTYVFRLTNKIDKIHRIYLCCLPTGIYSRRSLEYNSLGT